MRRRRADRRDVLPDPKYTSKVVTKFVNMIMEKGKKSTAERIVYSAMDIISEKTGNKNSIEVLQKAFDNSRPFLEVKPRRVGGATYQIPVEVSEDRGLSISMQWIRENARKRPGHSMSERLSAEMMDAYNGVGASMKKREDTHKMAEANKAFAHFRW